MAKIIKLMSAMRTYLSFSGDWQNYTIILDSG